MTWEYLHLIAHSFPIVLSVSGTIVGLVGWTIGREALERWALVAFLIAGLFALPAYLTGLSAADVVADRTFVRPTVIQTHRFFATWALIPVVSAGALAGFALYESQDARLRRFVLLVGVLAAVALGWTASHGVRIQHGDVLQRSIQDVRAAPVWPTRGARVSGSGSPACGSRPDCWAS